LQRQHRRQFGAHRNYRCWIKPQDIVTKKRPGLKCPVLTFFYFFVVLITSIADKETTLINLSAGWNLIYLTVQIADVTSHFILTNPSHNILADLLHQFLIQAS